MCSGSRIPLDEIETLQPVAIMVEVIISPRSGGAFHIMNLDRGVIHCSSLFAASRGVDYAP